MPTYLLDTSIIIDVLNNKRERPQLLKSLLDQGHSLACCAINVSEVYAGLRPKEELRTREFLESLDYLEVTWEIARHAGLLKRDYGQKGQALSLADATLAALAIEHGCPFITDNRKHFPMKNLSLFDA
jgi:predicted nucleic acid-binding protein